MAGDLDYVSPHQAIRDREIREGEAREAPEAEQWTLYLCTNCGQAIKPDQWDEPRCVEDEGEGGPWCNSSSCLPETPSMVKVVAVPERRALAAEARVRELEEALGKVAFLEAARRALSSPPEEGTGA